MTECDCGAAIKGKWEDVHAPSCASLNLPGIGSKIHELAEEIIQTELIGIDHRQRCCRLAVLLYKTAEEWMKANPPKI